MSHNQQISTGELNAVNLALQVQSMRSAQKQYFLLKGKASKTKHPDDWKLAGNALRFAQAHEKIVDEAVAAILQPERKEVVA